MTIQSKSNKTGGPCISCRFDGGKSGLLCSFILRNARIYIEFLMTCQVTHWEIYLFKYFLPVCIVEIFVVSPVFQDLDPPPNGTKIGKRLQKSFHDPSTSFHKHCRNSLSKHILNKFIHQFFSQPCWLSPLGLFLFASLTSFLSCIF